MCGSWFDNLFHCIISIYEEAEDRFNKIFDDYANDYLEHI